MFSYKNLFVEYTLMCRGRVVYDRESAKKIRALRNPYLAPEDQEIIIHCEFCGGLHLIARWTLGLMPIRPRPSAKEVVAWADTQQAAREKLNAFQPRRMTSRGRPPFPFLCTNP